MNPIRPPTSFQAPEPTVTNSGPTIEGLGKAVANNSKTMSMVYDRVRALAEKVTNREQEVQMLHQVCINTTSPTPPNDQP